MKGEEAISVYYLLAALKDLESKGVVVRKRDGKKIRYVLNLEKSTLLTTSSN